MRLTVKELLFATTNRALNSLELAHGINRVSSVKRESRQIATLDFAIHLL